MEPNILIRGTDEPIYVNLYTDKTKSVPVNIDDLEDLQIRVSVGEQVIGSWSKLGTPPNQLEKINAFTYFFWFVTDDNTPTGLATFWVEAITPESELPDTLQNTIGMGSNLINIISKPY